MAARPGSPRPEHYPSCLFRQIPWRQPTKRSAAAGKKTEERSRQKQRSSQHIQRYSSADRPAKSALQTVDKKSVLARIGAEDFQNHTTKKPPQTRWLLRGCDGDCYNNQPIINLLRECFTWHRAIFSGGYPPNIVAADAFHNRVRDGSEWDHTAMDTRIDKHSQGVNPENCIGSATKAARLNQTKK